MELGAAPSAPAQGNGPTTTSGFPVAPVQAGMSSGYDFRTLKRTLKESLFSEQFYRSPDFGTDYLSPLVPHVKGPRGGIDVQRHMAGTGIPFADPMDNFNPGHSEIDKRPTPVRRPSRPSNTSTQRHKGITAYRKVNKDNIDVNVDKEYR